MSADILESEISISGYVCFRGDRNRHGGGVIIYVSQLYDSRLLCSHAMLEIVTVVISYGTFKCCISLFYRPPNSLACVDNTFQEYLESIGISRFSLFILLGDFNINVLNCVDNSLCNVLSLFGLTQIVNHPTHIHNHVCKSLIDLVFLSDVSYLSHYDIIPPLSNSDHLGIHVAIKTKLRKQPCRQPSKHCIWHYTHTDWNLACELIEQCNRESLFDPDIDIYWSNWLEAYMQIMEEAIPKVVLPVGKNLPWLTRDIKKAIKARNRIFKRESYSARYRKARNKVVSLLRKAKSDYFYHLNPHDSKSFWKSVKYLSKTSSGIPTLIHENVEANTDKEKADLLNKFFSSCFNTYNSPVGDDPPACSATESDVMFIECSVEEVVCLLSALQLGKASGPDGVSLYSNPTGG